jgi:multisubunit Na+/H+ antiporter MnhB subunit
MEETMIYIFAFTIIYTFIKQRDKLLKEKKNLALYLILSIMGLSLGVVYLVNPYLPSLSLYLEKYLK